MIDVDSVLDDLGRVAAITPEGLPSGAADTTASTVAVVAGVDVAGRLVMVWVRGVALWAPAQPGRYVVGGLARVLLDQMTSAPVLVVGPLEPAAPVAAATVEATTSETVTVTWQASPLALPAVASSYTVESQCWVLLDDWGRPCLVLGPTTAAATEPPPPTPPPTPPPAVVQATATIGPQWSSGWRVSGGRWGGSDGPTDLFQGTGPGIGTVVGLATYGDQIVNLGAASVLGVRVRVQRLAGGAYAPVSLVLQGSPHASQPGGAPSGSGATVTLPAVAIGGWAEADLPAGIVSDLASGAAKGLVVAGSVYSRWGGTATPGSMVLTVTYTRAA